ncbi:MAG: ABC transporter permease [Actinomycetota bacterium]
MRLYISQLRQELTVMARNGEQLLLLVFIPVLVLVFFSRTDFLPIDEQSKVDFLMSGVLALAIMSTAMVSLGIATGFERSYGVLRRLGTTPLGTGRLVAAKVSAVLVIELVQFAILIGVGLWLDWRPTATSLPTILASLVIGSAAFAGIGLTLAGRLRAEVNLAAQNGLYLLLLLLGGILLPNEELPNELQGFAALLPSKSLGDSLRDSFSGDTATNSLVILAVWAAATCGIAALSFRWSD